MALLEMIAEPPWAIVLDRYPPRPAGVSPALERLGPAARQSDHGWL